jgi:penicillin-insensitive murein endopeptidase
MPRDFTKTRRVLFLTVVALFAPGSLAFAAGFNPWPKLSTPSAGAARAIGGYSAGCLAGAQPLALDGEGYQVMHPGRARYFGHPDLLDFIQNLGRGVRARKLDDVLIGDLSQARGGRASGGHSSHQSGLDVDIWYWAPGSVRKGPLATQQREKLTARSVIDGKSGKIRAALRSRVAALLQLASADPRVERIFVHPIIKRDLCSEDTKDRTYLRKIRPWHGHDDHLHARLACPKDSPECTPQEPFAQGDGCDELDWWFDEKAQADRKEAQQKYQTAVVEGKGWPSQCNALLK